MYAEWFGFKGLSLVLLGLTLGAQVILRSFSVRHIRIAISTSCVAIFGLVAYLVYLQHALWSAHPLGKFFLPPHRSIDYFWDYVLSRIIGPWAIALFAACVAGYIAYALNKRFHGRFFEKEEPFLFALAVFLTGYPGFFFYIALMLVGGIFFSMLRKMGRAPFYYLWLPLAISAILIQNWLIPEPFLNLFNL